MEIHCRRCGKGFKTYKNNFHKKKQSKSGYDYDCKSCNKDQRQEWLKKQTPEKIEEMRLENIEIKKQGRKEGRYREADLKYLDKKRESNKLYARRKRFEVKLNSYMKKFYWEEKRDIVLFNILPEEY